MCIRDSRRTVRGRVGQIEQSRYAAQLTYLALAGPTLAQVRGEDPMLLIAQPTQDERPYQDVHFVVARTHRDTPISSRTTRN